MPHFRLGSPTRKWFSKIRKTGVVLEFDFDLYYLCALLGLASGQTSAPEDATDVIDRFIADYTETQHLLLGLFVLSELASRGIDPSERSDMQRIMDQLLAPNDLTGLSSDGMSRLNGYASGGYEYLAEKYGKPPEYVETFLQRYTTILNEAVAGNVEWKQLGMKVSSLS